MLKDILLNLGKTPFTELRHRSGHFIFLEGQLPDWQSQGCWEVKGGNDTRIPQPPPCCTSFYRPIKGAPTQWSPCYHRDSVKALNPEQVVDRAVLNVVFQQSWLSERATLRWPRRPLEYWCQVEQKPRGKWEHMYIKNALMRGRRQVEPQKEHAALTHCCGLLRPKSLVTYLKVQSSAPNFGSSMKGLYLFLDIWRWFEGQSALSPTN